MTKSNILGLLAILGLSAMILVSCGGGSGSGKKLATNEFLGDMPNLIYQKAYNDSIRKAEEKTEEKKLEKEYASKKLDESAYKKGMELYQKFETRKKEEDAKFKAEIEKIKPQLVGKEIPFEMEEGCGYEVSGLKISDLSNAGVKVEFEVTITDEKAVKIYQWGTLSFYFQVLDKEENPIGKSYYGEVRHTTIIMSQKNGVTAKGSFYLIDKKDAKEMVNFAKIKFVKVQ